MTTAAAALERNDRYLLEFVEALGICPFARPCREGGRLLRKVLVARKRGELVEEAGQAIAELEAAPASQFEVALLLCPSLETSLSEGAAGARDFERVCAELRDERGRAHGGRPSPFACVAFHPDLPEDLGDEHRAVRFFRRSPDPTLQVVRASTLEAVRGPGAGSTFLDTAGFDAIRLAAVPPPPLDVSERIARCNWERARGEKASALRALLASLRLPAPIAAAPDRAD